MGSGQIQEFWKGGGGEGSVIKTDLAEKNYVNFISVFCDLTTSYLWSTKIAERSEVRIFLG